jgi:hypothetical protein
MLEGLNVRSAGQSAPTSGDEVPVTLTVRLRSQKSLAFEPQLALHKSMGDRPTVLVGVASHIVWADVVETIESLPLGQVE